MVRVLRLATALGVTTTATNRRISLSSDLTINGLFASLLDFRGVLIGQWNRDDLLHMNWRMRVLRRETAATLLRKLTAD